MKFLVVLALIGSINSPNSLPVRKKDFKNEAEEYFLPSNQLEYAFQWNGATLYDVCFLKYPNQTYYALGKCKDVLK